MGVWKVSWRVPHEQLEALESALDMLLTPPDAVSTHTDDERPQAQLDAYFTDPPDRDVLAGVISSAPAAEMTPPEQTPDIDWTAHVLKGLHPIEAGRFFVYGAHDADRRPAGKTAIRIEAGQAFGTGHHETTRTCLLAIDQLASDGVPVTNALDLGCGSGVLAIAIAKCWPQTSILASDNDPLAVAAAIEGAQINAARANLHCLEAEGFDHSAIQTAAPFDLITANILAQPLITLAPAMHAHMAPGARLILSGLLARQEEAVCAAYEAQTFSLDRRWPEGDWMTLEFSRPG